MGRMKTMEQITASNIHTRFMNFRDVTDAVGICSRSFRVSYNADELSAMLRQREIRGTVIENEKTQQIYGFSLYQLLKHELHLITLAVDADYRRHRFGSLVIHKLINKLSPQRRYMLSASVEDDNLGGQLFLRDCGLRCRGSSEFAFLDGQEKALLFTLDIRQPVSGYPWDGLHEGSGVFVMDTSGLMRSGEFVGFTSAEGSGLHLLLRDESEFLVPCSDVAWVKEYRSAER